MEELLVVKIGGNIIDDEKALNAFLEDFASIKGYKILVHGGGKLATELSAKLGIETTIVNGRRITDKQTIDIVTMTYAGLINKRIVASLQSKGSNALGLSGVDAKLLPAVKRPVAEVDYGWVGDLLADKVNASFLQTMLKSGLTPVIAPITCNGDGDLLNVNADTVANVLAIALSGVFDTTLIYCFEKNGLLLNMNDQTSVIADVNRLRAEELKSSAVISKGMLPKIDNAFAAISEGVKSVIIGHAAQIRNLANKEKGYGTHVTA